MSPDRNGFLRAAAFAGIFALGCTKSASGPTITGPAPLTTITVSPSSDTLVVFATQLFTAVGKDGAGNIVALTPAWSMANGDGTVNAAGLFTAGGAPGTSVVQVQSGSISAFAAVTVTAATTPPGTLASISITPNPVTLAALQAQQFTAVGKDGAGNVVAITPTWSIVNGGGTISGSGMFTAGTSPGQYLNNIKATSGAVSGYASVSVSPVTQLVFITLPETTPAGQAIAPAVRVAAEDSVGNIVTSFNGPVTLTAASTWTQVGAVLTGTFTVPAANGIASFSDLRISQPGLGWGLSATAPGFGSVRSGTFTVTGATPRRLAFMQEPVTSPVGRVFRIMVVVQDSVGSTVVTYTGPITLSIGANPGGATPLALTMPPYSGPGLTSGFAPGVANFGSLGLDKAGVGYTLVATADGLESATSVLFDITP